MVLEGTARNIENASSEVREMLLAFGVWLDHQRGLSPATIDNYCRQVKPFLEQLQSPVEAALGELTAGKVTTFMLETIQGRSTNSVKSIGRSLRSFLRFAHATDRTKLQLWDAVPTAAGWHVASLPKAVPSKDIQHLLTVAKIDRFSAVGRRDYAVLLLLVRLGLRRGEVANLTLDDIDWRAGELVIVGKNRIERLPLPDEPGEAVSAWLCDGRPSCQFRSVFTSVQPPTRPLSSGAVGHIVGSACQAAGLTRIGAHRVRHTLATEMLRAGASLPEVGQVLRHRSPRSTAIYAKVDEVALRPLASPWPGSLPEPLNMAQFQDFAPPWPGDQS